MPRRLNPFALPSETTLRFVLLILAAVATSMFIANWLYFTLSDPRPEAEHTRVCLEAQQRATQVFRDPLAGGQVLQSCMAPSEHRKGRLVLLGPVGVLGLGSAIYLAWPLLIRRRRKLRPLPPDLPQLAVAVGELSREAGLRREPQLLWNPLRSAGGALAFGTPWRPKIGISAGLVVACLRDRPAFDAVLRHELAHLRNGDVTKAYFAIAVWWALVVGGFAPLLVALVGNDGVVDIVWRLAGLALLVYLTRNALLRSRESYADLRAAVWDGPSGALRRVLEAMPDPGRRSLLRRIASLHPEPAERRRLVDSPNTLFRLDAFSAFLAGAAAGLAFPEVLNLLRLLTIGTSAYADVNTYAAIVVAPWVACVLTVAAWRATQAEVAVGEASRTIAPAVSLAIGMAAGEVLSLEAVVDTTSGAADLGRLAFAVAWVTVLVIAVLLFTRWLLLCAAAWLPLARRSPRWILVAACALSSATLAWGFGQLSGVNFFLDNLREAGALDFLTRAQVGRSVVDLVTKKDVTFAVLMLAWAFPLAALLWPRRPAHVPSWAYLDPAPGRELLFVRPAVKPALAVAALAGVMFLLGLVVWRAAIHATVPLAERDTDSYILSFVYRLEWIGIALQAAVAVVVALRARSAGVILGLLAAFACGVLVVAAMLGVTRAAGCVDAIAVRPGGTCPAAMETSFMWTTLKDWVNEGALLALVTLPVALGTRELLRMRTPSSAFLTRPRG